MNVRTLNVLHLDCLLPHHTFPISAKRIHYLLLPINSKLTTSRPSLCPNKITGDDVSLERAAEEANAGLIEEKHEKRNTKNLFVRFINLFK